MIEVLLDHQLGYCCCTGVPQVRVMSPSVQARANGSQRHGFSERDSCAPWGFVGYHLNLDRGPSGAEYGQPLNLDWKSEHSWADRGNIDWDLFWDSDCLFGSWGWVGSRDDWWCT